MRPGARFSVEVPGGSLAAERWGSGDPVVVLLHAGVCDRRSWYSVVDAFGDTGTLVAFDRRGFGESLPGRSDYSALADLLAVLDVAAGRPVWLVGSSMGGALALDCAVTEPDRVRGLVLLAPAVTGAPESLWHEVDDPDAGRLEEQAAAAAEAGDLAEAARLEVRLWLDGPSSPEGRVGGPARALALEMDAIALGHDAAADRHRGDSGVEAWGRLPGIGVPTTVAYGDLDERGAPVMARALADRIPGARTVTLHGVAHLPYLEDPAMVASLLREAIGL